MKQKRILILDDDADLLEICTFYLSPKYNVIKNTSALEAIADIEENWKNIDLIICDINMPGINGDEFLQLLKDKGIKIPFLAISGSIQDSKSSNYDALLLKPFDEKELQSEVENIFLASDLNTEES